jgi:hypothetical protein
VANSSTAESSVAFALASLGIPSCFVVFITTASSGTSETFNSWAMHTKTDFEIGKVSPRVLFILLKEARYIAATGQSSIRGIKGFTCFVSSVLGHHQRSEGSKSYAFYAFYLQQ